MIDRILLAKLTGEEKLWCMFSPVTRHPFLYCDPETNEDQIFCFSSEEALEDTAQAFLDLMFPVTKVGIKKEEKRKFFIDNRMLGVSEVVFVDEGTKINIPLEDILSNPDLKEVSGWDLVPDFSKLPEASRPLSNPGLQTTMMYFAQELNRDVSPEEKKAGISYHIEEFQANLARAVYIAPIMADQGKKLIPGMPLKPNDFGMVVLNDKEGKQWLPLFTDDMEFTMFNTEKKLGGITGKLKELLPRLPEGGAGVLLNANSVSMQLKKELLDKILETYQDA